MSEIDAPLFRAPKRRKTTTTSKPLPPSNLETNSNSSVEDDDHTKTSSSFVKPRTQVRGKPRFNGMQFSNTSSRQLSDSAHNEDSMALVPVAGNGELSTGTSTHGLDTRFVGSGVGVGRDSTMNDPNITAYIDAELARRREVQTQTQRDTHFPPSPHPPGPAKPSSSTTTVEGTTKSNRDANESQNAIPITSTSAQRQKSHGTGTGTHHHLSEIDLSSLPPPPTRENQALPPRKKKPKIRLGRDGKPYRPRPRPSPNPEDVAREQLVEQILNEGGVGVGGRGVYSSTTGKRHELRGMATNANGKGGDEDADERMEREFTREFLERQQVQSSGGGGGRGAETKSAGVKDTGGAGMGAGVAAVLSSGPRLGGSRSARARMVAALEKERDKEKEKDGK